MDDDDSKILTLEPLLVTSAPHDTVFINELKLSEFKQILSKANIPSEVQAGVLLCCNGTIAVRRVSISKNICSWLLLNEVTIMNSLSYER